MRGMNADLQFFVGGVVLKEPDSFGGDRLLFRWESKKVVFHPSKMIFIGKALKFKTRNMVLSS